MAIIDLPRTQAASGSTEQQLKAISDQIRVFRDQVERQLIDLESGTVDTAASSAALSQIVSDISDIQNEHETDINTINTALGNKLDTTGDGKDVTVSATAAATKANLSTGEKLSVSIGKLMKWFTDFATVAWSGSYNDLSDKPSPSSAGFLDAHPIGSVYITTNSDESTAAQMATKYGGTWVAASQGRAIFGAGNNGVNDIAAGDTGGSSYLQSHNHAITVDNRAAINTGTVSAWHTHQVKGYGTTLGSGSTGYRFGSGGSNTVSIGMQDPSANHYHTVPIHGHTASAANTGSGDAENIPPYEAFYVYKRTA